MCRDGSVEMDDGVKVSLAELNSSGNAFERFCKTLDPNTCYIGAYLPFRADEEVFYRARDLASSLGVHMQATVEKADTQIRYWDHYRMGHKA